MNQIITSMMLFTDFENKLFHLSQIYNRLSVIRRDFDKLPRIGEYNVVSVIREYAIIQMDNFLDIKKSIESDPALKNKKNLKKCLKPFSEPIESRSDAIRKLRDSFYAHIGDKKGRFDGYMEEVIEGKFPKNPEEIVFLAACICGYIQYFAFHFQTEWDALERKIDSRPRVKREPHRSYAEIESEIRNISIKVGNCLGITPQRI